MTSSTTLISSVLLLLLLPLLSHAAIFDIKNNCTYTVWAAAVPGGGTQLNPGQTWTISVPSGTTGGRVWGRTGCTFDGNGKGKCNTGDCGGVLQCTGYGSTPDTHAEFDLNYHQDNQILDRYQISLVDGFNIPMGFAPTNVRCHHIRCRADNLNLCKDRYTIFTCPSGTTNYRVTFCP